MSDLITRTARLVPYAKRPRQVPSFVTAYSYEPLANEPGAELGNLYVVIEVLVSGRASEEVADLIIETIGEHYYNHPKAGTSVLERFEAAIKATNQELGEHVNRGNAAWIGKLSAVIAVQNGAELHVAQTGSAEAFLYRGKAATHVTPPSTNRPATPTKTFGSLASGQLEPEDRLLMATPALIHQVPLAKLQSVISQSSPNAAISEITQLLQGVSTDRIAALIIETTTPELAALQVRSEQPDEIQLGVPDNVIEAAKLAATPIAQNTVKSSKKVADIAHTELQRLRPHLRSATLAVVRLIRQLLSTKAGRLSALIGVIVCALLFTGWIWYQNSSARTAKFFGSYQQAYQTFRQAEQQLADGDKTSARDNFQAVQRRLTELKEGERLINKRLQTTAVPEGEPKTMQALLSLVGDRLDQIDGLVKIDATTVISLPAKNAQIKHFQIFDTNAYLFDAGNGNALSIVNLVTGSIKTSRANTSKLGDVINTTISSANDGLYLLTTKPSVWFYRFDTDTITEQTVAFSQWPQASAIASYASNIYLLGDSAIYKHTKNATGFSPKTDYLSTTTDEAKGTTGLAIDGSVYLLSPTGLHRYLSGALKQSAPMPDTLTSITDLRVSPGGTVIVGASSGSKRIGIWTARADTLAFSKQIAPNNLSSLYGATYDPKSRQLYATTDSRLVRIAVQP